MNTARTDAALAPAPGAQQRQHRGAVGWQNLVQWLEEDGLITPEHAHEVRQRCSTASSGQSAIQRLAAVGIRRASDDTPMDAQALTRYLADVAGLEYLRIDPLNVDAGQIAQAMGSSYAERYRILPVRVGPREIVVATSDPFVTEWVAEVARQSGRKVRLVLADPVTIRRYTAEFYALARSVQAAQKRGSTAGLASFEQLVELGRTGAQLDANDQGIIRLVDWLWQYAFEQHASDIHLEPRRDQGVVRFRIDGVLHPVYQVPTSVMAAMTARVKLLGRMDVVERRRPQDGRIKARNPAGEEIEMRLSTLPTAFGEKLVMRIFDPDTAVKSLAALGFTAHDARRWEGLVSRPHGIILVTGPTGSGKTTTLYSTLRRVATEEVNVSTIEDPIERIEPALNQTQVEPKLDFSFAEGVRSLMRQDPDIIMIGEIRDLETAEMAVQAALTGHLVFSTLYTNDAPLALARLMELGVPPYLLSATMLGVMAQRLVRTLCTHCKVPDESASTEALTDAVHPWTIKQGEYHPYKAVGCVECRMTGYRGRMGIYELITVTEAFRALVHHGATVAELRRQAIADGMRPLRVAGAMRAAEGLTTLSEVITVTPPLE